MLFPFKDYFKQKNLLEGRLRGEVVDNEDHNYLGRIKVTIPNIMEAGDPKRLPWVYPRQPVSGGGGNSVAIPKVGTKVWIEFNYGEPYFGEYIGVSLGARSVNPAFQTSEVYGNLDEERNGMMVNLMRQTMVLSHSSGSAIAFDKEGNIVLRSNNKVRFESDGGSELEFDNDGGRFRGYFKEMFNVMSERYFVNVGEVVTRYDSVDEVVAGKKIEKVQGVSVLAVASSRNESVGGNFDRVVVGDSSVKVVGVSENILGQGEKRVILTGGSKTDITQGDYALNLAIGAFKLINALGDIKVDTPATISIGSKSTARVNIGPANQPNLKGRDTVKWLTKHTHGTPVGASSVPLNAADAMDLLSEIIFSG